MKNGTLALFGLLFLASLPRPAVAVGVVSRWVMPTRPNGRWELKPLERTRPLIIGDEILYFANLDGEVRAVHRRDAYVLWKKKVPGAVEGALAYGRSKLFVGDTQGNLIALHTHDGTEAWRYKADAEWLSAPLVVRDRVIAMTSSEAVHALQDTAVDGKPKELWHYSRRGDEKMTIRGAATPVAYGNEVFQGFSDGYLVAIGLTDGKELWPKRLRTRERFYDVDATPFVDDKNIISATFDGKVYCFDRVSRELQWVFPVGSYSGFYVENDRVYFAGLDGHVYAVNRANGQLLWKTPYGKGVGLQPTRAGDYLVITTSSDPVLVLDPADGKIVWSGRLGTGSLAAAAGTKDGWFYAMSNYGNLYAFEVRKDLNEKPGPATVATPSAFYRTGPRPADERATPPAAKSPPAG